MAERNPESDRVAVARAEWQRLRDNELISERDFQRGAQALTAGYDPAAWIDGHRFLCDSRRIVALGLGRGLPGPTSPSSSSAKQLDFLKSRLD